jgi:hypothetical protein
VCFEFSYDDHKRGVQANKTYNVPVVYKAVVSVNANTVHAGRPMSCFDCTLNGV